MQISDTTSSGASSQAQRLLASLMAQRAQGTGQDASGEGVEGAHKHRAPPPGPPPSGPPPGADSMASSQFSSDTLSQLLSAQEEPPSSEDIASQLISDVDTDGDGTLSADEIKTALGSTSETGESDDTGSAEDAFAKAFAKLDSDGDSMISTAELTSALEAFKSAHDPSKRAQATATQEVAA